MARFWVGLLLLSAAWQFWFPLFAPQIQWGRGLILAGAGVACIAWASRTGAGRRKQLWSEAIRGNRPALWFCGVVLAGQFLALHSLRTLVANHHELRFLSPMLFGLARLLGLPAALDNGMLFFRTEEDVLLFVSNWDKVGFVMPMTLLIAMSIALGLSARSWKDGCWRWLLGLTMLGAYTLVRYFMLCGWLIEFGDAKGANEAERLALFTAPWPTLLTYLPFALLAARLRLLETTPPLRQLDKIGCRPWAKHLGLIGAGVFFGLAAWNIRLPGPAKTGRILVDDAHSGFWEPALPRLETNGFGSPKLYNCSSLVEWFQHFRSAGVNADQPITEALLRDVAVLVLKTPIRRFTPEEIAVVLAFVKRGGGLLLIGDHTNLLGMSTYLNEIASHFGIEFRYDASNAYSTGYFSGFKPPWLFAHPIVEGIPPLRFMTSCTLRHSFCAEAVIIAHDLISDPVDYSKPSFFGKLTPSPKNGFGLFPLAVARRFGQGRVVAFAESTTMSNFSLFQDGTAPLLLRMVNYLNQTNRELTLVKWLLGLLALGLFAMATRQLSRLGRMTLICGLGFGSLLGYGAAGLALKWFNTATFPAPSATRPLERVAYLTDAGLNYDIPPAIGPSLIPEQYAFDALFVVPQRYGAFPSLTCATELRTGQFRAVVAINPTDKVSPTNSRRLADYVSAGGQLLIVQEPNQSGRFLTNLLSQTHAPRLLFERQLTLPSLIANADTLINSPGITNVAALPAALVEALKPRTLTWTAWSAQSGSVHVLSDSTLFSRAWLGNVMGEPTEPQRRAYELLFAVFQELLGPMERPQP